MKKISLILVFLLGSLHVFADRIYVFNSPGYNGCEPQLAAAIASNGHTVVVNSTTFTSLPAGFESSCTDPINGYDWLCFFGDFNFTGLIPQIKNFIDSGGKVFYQYEVTCCNTASSSAAAILSALTGLTITPNGNPYVGFSGSAGVPGWEATGVSCCANMVGAAYKGLDGMPLANQLVATATLNAASPPITACPNFGFRFTTTDFVGTAHKGAIVGVGDVNLWYDSDEPFSNGGSTPVNMSLINFFFPNDTTTCLILPPGCLDTFNIQNFITFANIGNDTTLCPGDTLILNATNAGATYLWQNGSTNPTFTVTMPGTYWVQITKGNCLSSDTIIVGMANQQPIYLGNDTSLCSGSSLVLQSGISGANYLWQDGSTNPSFTVSATGTYWLQLTTGCGVVSDTIQVSVINPPNIQLGNDTILCNGDNLVLNAFSAGSSYVWQNGSTNASFTASLPGTYWVQVTNGPCTNSDTIHISTATLQAVNLGNDTTLCTGSTYLLQSGSVGAVYLWQNGSTNSTFLVTGAGQYWVQVTTGCGVASDTIQIATVNPPVVQLGNDTILCPGNNLLLNAFVSGASYTWQNSSNAATYLVNSPGTYWVHVNYLGCIGRDTINVNYFPVQTINLGKDTAICAGQSFMLSAATAGATYQWQDNSTNATLIVNQAGTYWVKVSTNCGDLYDTIQVGILNLPSVNLGNDTVLCDGDNITLSGFTSGASAYQWNDNSIGSTLNVTQSGIYWVHVTTTCGISADTINITFNNLPTVNLGLDTIICPGDTIKLLVNTPGVSAYLWQNQTSLPYLYATQPGLYWVQVWVNNCIDRDSLLITPNTQCECNLFVPNAFSPNNDFINDEFKLLNPIDIELQDLMIYNRWGNQVFKSTNLGDSWNGHYKGLDSETGVYYYVLRYICLSSGKQYILKGDITLIR